ncbi:MAG: SpoIID/LytB domain-containing protein [Elusimicrobia bacterium]|nr:SpoIID/LytB domain-containing protein [Elusimicrobiota bacterium]
MSPVLLLLAAGPARAEAAPRISDSIIQIGIVQKAPSVVLRAYGGFSVVDQKTGETHELKDREDYAVEAGRGALRFGPYRFLGQVRLIPKSAEDFVQIGEPRVGAPAGRYHGSLLVRHDSDATLTVVQETGIEEYLYGVLAKEMSPEWEPEALKAQAVVSRTFTLTNLGKFGRAGFDFSVDQRSQVYAGLDSRDERATAAVRATQGEVLFHQGKVVKAFFHACCGGATSNVGATWGNGEKAERPVRGVKDRWCSASPHMEWTAYFTFADILHAINRHGKMALRLKGIGRGAEDATGRLKTIKLFTDAGTVVVRANEFRNWMGSTDLKSAFIERITRRKKGYAFSGRGFGHGVGLCQWGAQAMALKGKSYREILEHYFPGADVVQRED